MSLHFPTLNLFTLTLLLAASIVFAIICLQNPRRPGIGFWLLGCLALAGGYLVRWWHSESDPSENYWLAGVLYLSGNMAIWVGLLRFLGHRPRWSANGTLLLFAAVWLAVAWLSYPQQVAASLLLSAAACGLSYHVVKAAAVPIPNITRQFVAAIFLVSALVLAARGLAMFGGFPFAHLPVEQQSALGSIPSTALIMLRCFALLVLLHAIQEWRLQELAELDPLTGLLNRKGFWDKAHRKLDRLAPTGRATVMMFDLDHFKQINDEYGHACGDLVLKAFAKQLKNMMRPDDIVCRIGGEEFAVLLCDLDDSQAAPVAERLRQHWQQTRLQHEGKEIHATVSIGISPSAQPPLQLEALLKQADQALYQAKAQGRNRVAMALAQASAA